MGNHALARPSQNASEASTRPQLTIFPPSAEMTAAANIADPIPTTQQTFEDVSSSNTFWLFIEQLAGRGVISGYTCGGAGEPCVPPGSRPYFRWGANATRGQMSKIGAETFFPNCQTPQQ